MSKGLVLAVIGALVLIWGACAPAAAPAPKGTKTQAEAPKPAATAAKIQPLSPPVAVKVGLVPAVASGAVFIADERGYFKELGINVETVVFDSGGKIIPALASGQVDVGMGGISAGLFNSIARGIDIKIVSGAKQEVPGKTSNFLVVRKDLIDGRVIKDYPDLKGKTIAVNGLDVGAAIDVDKALAKGNLKSSDVNIGVLGWAEMLAAFTNKSLDAAIMVEPFITSGEEKNLLVAWKGTAEFYPGQQTSVYMYSSQFIARNPEAGKRFMAALLKAARDLEAALVENKSEQRDVIVSIMSKATKVEPATFNKMRFSTYQPDGYPNIEGIIFDQDWFFQQRLVEKKVDVGKAFDNQFVDYAIGVLGRYKQ